MDVRAEFCLPSAVALNVGLLTVMAVWQPTSDSHIPIFVIVGLWGVADGVWMTQSNSVLGAMFLDEFESAFTGLRIMQGLGAAIGFAYAEGLCMAVKLYILMGICVAGMIGYLLAERIYRRELRKSDVEVEAPQTS